MPHSIIAKILTKTNLNKNEETSKSHKQKSRFSIMLHKYLCSCSGVTKRNSNSSSTNALSKRHKSLESIEKVSTKEENTLESMREGDFIGNIEDNSRVKMKLVSVRVVANEEIPEKIASRSSLKQRDKNLLHPMMAIESYPKFVTSNNIQTDRGCLVNIRTGSFNLGTEIASMQLKVPIHQVPSFNVSLYNNDSYIEHTSHTSDTSGTHAQPTNQMYYLNVHENDQLRRSSHDPNIEMLHKNYINNIKLLGVPTTNTSVATLSESSFFISETQHDKSISNSKSAEVLSNLNELSKVKNWLTDSQNHVLSASVTNISSSVTSNTQTQDTSKKRKVTYGDETFYDDGDDLDEDLNIYDQFEFIDKDTTNDSAVDVDGGSQDSLSTAASTRSRTLWQSFSRKYHTHFFDSTTWSNYQMSAMNLPQIMALRKLALIQFSQLIDAQKTSIIKSLKLFSSKKNDLVNFEKIFLPEELLENESLVNIPSTPTSPLDSNTSQTSNSAELKRALFRSKFIPSSTTTTTCATNILVDKVDPAQVNSTRMFGVPLKHIMRQTGQPLPQRIIESMKILRKTAPRALGIFRKNGNKLRIKQLREAIDLNESFNMKKLYSLYDIADTLKLYFRQLPECLITNRLSDILLANYGRMSMNERKMMLQQVMLLTSDENRLALQTLLLFLNDIARHCKTNEMTRSNLAICFSPILFHLNIQSPKHMKKFQKRRHQVSISQNEEETNSDEEENVSLGQKKTREFMRKKSKIIMDRSSESGVFKDYIDNVAKIGQTCVADMIKYCMDLFTVPIENFEKLKLSSLYDSEPYNLECYYDTQKNTLKRDELFTSLFQAHSSRDWSYFDKYQDVCIYFSKNLDSRNDGMKSHIYDKIRLWKCCTLVKHSNVNSFDKIIQRLRYERVLWDDDFKEGRVIRQLDESTCIFKYVTQLMPPHPSRDFTELQHLHYPNEHTAILTSTSVKFNDDKLVGDIKANTIVSKYIIEKLIDNTTVTTFKITHLIKVDYKGFTSEFYNQTIGHIQARLLYRLRSSFNYF